MENPSTFGDFMFIILTPQELREAFRFVSPGLEAIQKKAPFATDLHHIAMQVQANLATLVMIYSEERYAGFMIFKHQFLGMPNKHFLEVAVMYGEQWCFKEGKDIKQAADDWLVAIAKEYGCFALKHSVVRMGWGRPLEKLGYKKIEETWFKEI